MKKGFTLIEIMVVATIIILLAALTIPNLLRARISAQEAAAAAAMRTILTSQVQWRGSHNSYANLNELAIDFPPYIDLVLANGTKQGYNFYTPYHDANSFVVEAVHSDGKARAFFIDEYAILCRSNQPKNCPGGPCIGGTIVHAATYPYELGCPIDYTPVGQ